MLGNKRTFIAGPESAGMRADKFLAERMPEFSRSEIQRMEKNVENSHKLKAEEKIEVVVRDSCLVDHALPKPRTTNHEPRATILYEDDDVVAVDKPRGMVMYPAAGNIDGTLVQELAESRSLSALGGETRPGVVHRLDKDTSGVVILAKSDAAFRALAKTFSEHDLKRKYVAFVWGVPAWTAADIDGNIARSSRNRQKMSMVKTGGKVAKTLAEVMNVWTRAGVSEIRCTLMTGRTHQIRVHMSAHGFPVLTDPVYGRGGESKLRLGELLQFLRGHRGQCLHAEVLELAHPVTGAPLKLRAPLPADLQELKRLLNDY
ncbi:MAG: RluA family pseudouridine synthase [Rickettsiales bacterium]|nr:RluA family pseudouridine synthase [Rickettsiales bacterium]